MMDISVLKDLEDLDKLRASNFYSYNSKQEMIVDNLANKSFKFYSDNVKEKAIDHTHSGGWHYGGYYGRERILEGYKLKSKSEYYNFYQVMNEAFGITNVQPHVVTNQMDAAYAYLTYILGGKTKRANKLIERLIKLTTLEDFSRDVELTEVDDAKLDLLFVNSIVKDLDEREFDRIGFIKDLFDHIKDARFGEDARIYGMFRSAIAPRAFDRHNHHYQTVDHMGFNDYHSETTNAINHRALRLVSDMKHEYLIQVLDIMIARNDIDLHDFLESLTVGFYERLHDEGERYHSFVVQFLRRIKDVNKEDFLLILRFMNYRRVHLAPNVDAMKDQINYILDARSSQTGSGGASTSTSKRMDQVMLFNDKLYLEEVSPKERDTREILYTRDINEVNTIGTRTLNCFTPGGAAKSLLRVATHSPLSGILEGQILNEEDRRLGTWFAFVWEMMNKDKHGLFRSELILDNVEGSTQVPYPKFVEYVNTIYENSGYNQIRLGASRNDIDVNMNDINIQPTPRPHVLIDYESNFRSYSYDDSRNIYDVNAVVDLEATPAIEEVKIRRVDDGWFTKVRAVEQIIWGTNTDRDLKDINLEYSPSYVITGDDDVILGYLITRLVKVNKETGKIDFNYITKKGHLGLADDQEYGLLFEDVYLANTRNAVKGLSYIIDDLVDYIETNDIKYSSASPNAKSNSFIKRMKKHTEYIEDTRFGNSPDERININEEYRIPISRDMFKRRLKYIDMTNDDGQINLNEFKPNLEEIEKVKKEAEIYEYKYDL